MVQHRFKPEGDAIDGVIDEENTEIVECGITEEMILAQ